MVNRSLWTASGARLQSVSSGDGKNLHWLFVPGGPGLGSEIMHPLTQILKLPGTLWHLDLPGDGSNIPSKHPHLSQLTSIENWANGLLEAVEAFDNVVLVGHSRGGMFALALPELEEKLAGLVLLDAAPDMTWQSEFAIRIENKPLPGRNAQALAYEKHPDDATLKEFVMEGTPYMFTPDALDKGRKTFENLPYNNAAIQWTLNHFDPTYKAKWVPQRIPTLILAGSDDLATPLKYFAEKKEYIRTNITLREIKDAGHFPWIENPQDVAKAFEEYSKKLMSSHKE
ncbi:MAG: alpha/beta hydrolase, partial [Chlamydiota bacterium]